MEPVGGSPYYNRKKKEGCWQQRVGVVVIWGPASAYEVLRKRGATGRRPGGWIQGAAVGRRHKKDGVSCL